MTQDARAPRELYDATAGGWTRREPASVSDFTARPAVLAMCEPVAGRRVLDLGCGEGYCARLLRQRGAGRVLGIDISSAMIEEARRAEREQPLGIEYQQGDAGDLAQQLDASFDVVLAMFLFNYLTAAQTRACMQQVARVLAPGGRFVFAVPHPALPWLRPKGEPFYFEMSDSRYFAARDMRFPGRIFKRDGTSLDVQLVHKTIEDYFTALHDAGFDALPRLTELRVTPEILALDPQFFGPLQEVPLHLALVVRRDFANRPAP